MKRDWTVEEDAQLMIAYRAEAKRSTLLVDLERQFFQRTPRALERRVHELLHGRRMTNA